MCEQRRMARVERSAPARAVADLDLVALPRITDVEAALETRPREPFLAERGEGHPLEAAKSAG